LARIVAHLGGKDMASLKGRLVGTWRLVSLDRRASDGTSTKPLGTRASGLFIFTADGNFSVQLMDPDRTAGGADGYVASWGAYSTSDADATFVLSQEGSLSAEVMGTKTVRHAKFHDRTAVFTSDPEPAGALTTQFFITWERVGPSRER
jgi:hypothetical protein